jgi:HAD domain in Swiss Army Knife RNA repair proteins
MEVLFLDVDGVLNNFHQRNFGEAFSPPSCDALNSILDRLPDLKIVISSSWRMWGLDYMQKLLAKNGVRDAASKVIDLTGQEHGIRGYQIQCWLDRNPNVTKFAILDDESDMGPLLGRLVKTNGYVGLTSTDADRVVDLLK